MSQRSDLTKWLWCLFAVYVGPGWGRAVSVRTPPKNPTTIEAQAKFFQDFFSVQLSPYKIEFGHVCEDPNTWEQRYEKKDFKNHRDMGKVRWGDKQGGYGEHYWDLNHAGHAGNHGNDEYDSNSDDGSYNHDLDHAHEDHDAYDEPSEQLPTYGTEEYDPEQAVKYDDSGRAKRAQPRVKSDRKLVREEETYEEPQKQQETHRLKERLQAAPAEEVDKKEEDEENYEPQPPKRRRRRRKPENVHLENVEKQTDKVNQKEEQKQENLRQYYAKQADKVNKKEEQKQEELPQYYVKQTDKVNQKEEQKQEKLSQYYVNRAEKQFVPYEQGAGVRQHHPSEITPAASAPRLFLEPTTGHVVDRATGQAYVLQPIAINKYT